MSRLTGAAMLAYTNYKFRLRLRPKLIPLSRLKRQHGRLKKRLSAYARSSKVEYCGSNILLFFLQKNVTGSVRKF